MALLQRWCHTNLCNIYSNYKLKVTGKGAESFKYYIIQNAEIR